MNIWYNDDMKNAKNETRTTETEMVSRAEYEKLKQENEWLNGRVRWLEEQLKVLSKNHFGSKHESASEEVIGQMSLLFNEPEVYAYLNEIKKETVTVSEHERTVKKEKEFLLDKLPENIAVVAETHELSEEERTCPVCTKEIIVPTPY